MEETQTTTLEATPEVVATEEVRAPYVFPFKVGSDPEFTVISGTRPMNAQSVFTTFFEGMETHNGGYDFAEGNIGWDGHSATGELRPNPGTPREVVANIKSLFKQAYERMPFVDMTTLTIAAATGGHIHLEVPESLNSLCRGSSPKMEAIKRAIATFTVLIMMNENNLSRSLRRNFQSGNYGDVLDFRIDRKFTRPSGADGFTIEVRGPGAEWVTTEKIALGTFAYMAICWDLLIKGELTPIAPVLFKSQKQAHETLIPLLENYANMQTLYLNKIRPFVRSHPAYQEYKDEIELILNPKRVLAEKAKAHFSIAEGWGFSKETKHIPTNKFMNEDEIEQKTSRFPEQVIRNMSQFAWNDDLNVEQFATALSKRCVALGWKPQHEYFIFGLKKGFDEVLIRDEDGRFITGQDSIVTKGDYKLVVKKFDRLNKKAEPVYARVLNPRTGKLTSAKDNRRVMIGIPYEMRQKGDIKSIIRLVLKFEKSPKAFAPIDMDSLPDGASAIKEKIDKEEVLEVGIENALSRADSVRQVSPEVAQAEAEAEAAAAAATRGAPSNFPDMCPESRRILMTEIAILRSTVASMSSTASASNKIRALMRSGRYPTVSGSGSSREESLIQELAGIASEETDDLDSIIVSHNAAAYLIAKGIGMTNTVGISAINGGNYYHTIRRVSGGYYDIRTPSHTEGADGHVPNDHFEVVADLFGISELESVVAMQDHLDRNEGIWQSVRTTGGVEPGVVNIIPRADEIQVNPHPEFPHLWNA